MKNHIDTKRKGHNEKHLKQEKAAVCALSQIQQFRTQTDLCYVQSYDVCIKINNDQF